MKLHINIKNTDTMKYNKKILLLQIIIYNYKFTNTKVLCFRILYLIDIHEIIL